MKCRKSIIIMMLIIFMFAIAGVCASDVNDTEIAGVDVNEYLDGESSSVDALAMPDDDLSSAQEGENIESGLMSQAEDLKLAFEMGDFDILQALVYDASHSIVSLERNYTYSDSDTITEGIVIAKPITINGNGFTIDAKGKSRIFKVTAGALNITNITLKNGKAEIGAAILFENDISNSNIDAAFIDNTADLSAGAICFDGIVTHSNIGGTYINNCGMYGGANRFLVGLKSSNVTGTYIHNTARLGGANDFLYEVADSRIDGTYINNTSIGEPNSHGGANNFFWNVTGCTITGTYINNLAGQKGGAIHFNRKASATNISGIYINNTAGDGVISFKNTQPDVVISNGIFLDNRCTNVIWAEKAGGMAENNWFGNNETNCMVKPNIVGVEMDTWLFLTGEYAIDEIRFFLKSFNGTDAGDYDNSLVSDINLTVSAINGGIDKRFAKLEEAILFTPVSSGTATVTASIESAAQTVEIQVMGEFDLLQELVSDESLLLINLERNYTYSKLDTMKEGVRINRTITINGNGFVIDAKGKSRIFHVEASDVVIKNLTIKNANYGGVGGAIRFDASGSVVDCSFINNSANYGGAIDFDGIGNIINCSFDENTARNNDGGAVWIYSGTVLNCNFTDNNALSRGGAIYILTNGNVTDCNFHDNNAREGGAAVIRQNGIMANCNFTDNNAKIGGAVYFNDKGEVTTSNFAGNSASGVDGGGAVYMSSGSVRNCSFTNNLAQSNGGAVLVDVDCNISDCNFADNSASNGGAIDFEAMGRVENCNFTGNIASSGSAIYFKSDSSIKTVSNSIFLNNRADADEDAALTVIINENNIELIFMGRNNLINAIFSNGDVNFTNVGYWGEGGIENTDSFPPSRSNREAGQNITIGVAVNDEIVLNDVKVTDRNGTIVLDVKANGDYYITARHDSDSYYTGAETILANMKFYVNVTRTETTNKTVNITAKSNIKSEFMPGKLLFVLSNGFEIDANYLSDGIWWAEHTFEDYGEYQVNASYIGLDNVTSNNAIISVVKANSTVNISDIVLDYGDSKNVTVSTEGTTGITAMIDNVYVDVLNNYTISISGLTAGNHILTITTIADGNHVSVNKTVNVTVNKVNSTLTVNDMAFDYNTIGTTVVSFAGATNVAAKIAGHDETIVNVNGNTITISNISAGSYILTVTTVPDENHTEVMKTANITVMKVNAELTVNNINLDYGSSTNVTVTTEGAVGITAKINDQNATVINNTIIIPVLDVGTFTLTVTAIADANHTDVCKNAKIIVNKCKTELAADAINTIYNANDNLIITLKDYKGVLLSNQLLFVDLNGVKMFITDSNGQIKVSTKGLPANIYSARIFFLGGDNYKESNAEATVTINKDNTLLDADAVTAVYNENNDLVIVLKDSQANPIKGVSISVDLNGAKTVVTDDNGQVKVSTKGLIPKTYTAKITFNGNANYIKSTKDVKVTVKKATPKITASKKTFKCKVKTKKYTVTLKNNVGKAMKSEKVTIKIGKKTYSAKTNAKGHATFKIKNLKKKGTFKATIIFKGNKNYNKVSKTVKIKIK